MTDRSIAAVNLSYVLHEPSSSPTVTNYVREMRKVSARSNHVERRFQRMADHELSQRLIVDPAARDALTGDSLSSCLISVRVGMWRMLDRCLVVAGLMSDRDRGSITYLDGDCESTVIHPFFRAPARLCDPGNGTLDQSELSFAVAILRPDDNSILIRLERVEVERDKEESTGSLPERLVLLAEKSIREFTIQWDCERQLWDEPAEAVLSEFKL